MADLDVAGRASNHQPVDREIIMSGLIECPDCERDVSPRARTCPHCGTSAARADPVGIALAGVFVLLVDISVGAPWGFVGPVIIGSIAMVVAGFEARRTLGELEPIGAKPADVREDALPDPPVESS